MTLGKWIVKCIALVRSEAYRFISRDHIEYVAKCIEVLFCLCWRDLSDGVKQAAVVKPVDPSECGHFQILHVAPQSMAMNHLGFVKSIYSFDEGVVLCVTDAFDG